MGRSVLEGSLYLSGQIKEIDLRTMEGKIRGNARSSSEFVGTYSLGTGVSLTDMKSWKDSAPVTPRRTGDAR